MKIATAAFAFVLSGSIVAAQDQAWGPPVKGFALSLSAPRSVFKSQEHIIVTVHTKNAQESTLVYGDECQEPLVNKLVITTSDSKEARSKPPAYFSCGYSAAQEKPRQLQPGAEFTVQYDLRKSFPTLPNGKFRLRAFRDAGYSPNGTPRYVESNVLEITVVQ